jgi:hypothetical protein
MLLADRGYDADRIRELAMKKGAQRAAELKQLADAWQPLAATLTPERKQRLRFFAANILRLVPRAVDVRRMQDEDGSDED